MNAAADWETARLCCVVERDAVRLRSSERHVTGDVRVCNKVTYYLEDFDQLNVEMQR